MPNTELLTGALGAGRDATQRTLDAGREASQRTQDRVESLFREVLQTNLEQVEQAQKILEEFIERSRKASERFAELIDSEVRGQVEALSLATRADVRRLEDRISELEKAATSTAPRARPSSAAKASGTTTKKAAAKKAAATRSTTAKATTAKATTTKQATTPTTAKKASGAASTDA